VQQPEDAMKLIIFVGFSHVADQRIQLRRRPAIETIERHRLRIRRRIKVVKIGQHKSQRVADLAIFVAEFLDRLRAGGDIVLIVHAAAPQSQQVGSVTVDLIHRLDVFLVALADLRPIGFHDKPVRQDVLERRLPRRAHTRQQRKLKPPAMLVGAFQIQIRRE
jgi:hypothetical protein